MVTESVRYGVQAAEEAMSTGDRWPRLRPQEGDRARFHFLTDGSDPWLVGTKFHAIGEGRDSRNIVCLQALTHGVESCSLCEDTSNRRNMFGCWVWTEYILHSRDNPDEDGEAWEQKKLKLDTGRETTVFMEPIGGKPQLLWLPAGRQKVWWSQFTTAWMTSGNLRKHLYELQRIGSGRDDTNYILRTIKEDALPDEVLEREEVVALPSIEEIFRQSLRFPPATAGLLGSDSLDSAELEALPSATTPATSTEDDLI